MSELKSAARYRPETRLVHSGTLRSQYGETSEALFLTSGYAYNSAEEAEATFKGESTHFQYSRFGNPTVSMFEQRIAEFEGAEAAVARINLDGAPSSALCDRIKAEHADILDLQVVQL